MRAFVRRPPTVGRQQSGVFPFQPLDPEMLTALSGLNPAATASISVDLPVPLSPTRNVTPGARSSPPRRASHATTGKVNGSGR